MDFRTLLEQWWPVVLQTGAVVFPFLWHAYKLHHLVMNLGSILPR